MTDQIDDWPAVPTASVVHEAIAWWAEWTPDAPALLDITGETVSFRELQRRIEAFGARLEAFGIGRGDRVVLALPDGVGAVIAGLAACRVAIGVPVNPAQARAEAEPILTALAPRAVIVAESAETVFRDLAKRASVPVLTLDAVGLPVAGRKLRGSVGPEPAADDLALILLTSGTTDRPRRVPVTHRNLLATCSARVHARGYTPRDRGLNTAPPYFVLGLARVIESLISGGSAIVSSAADVVRFPDAVRDLKPTWTWMSPALLEIVLAAARHTPAFAEWPLRSVRLGGAQATPDLIARGEALWNVPVLSGYGTTETLGYISGEEIPDVVPRRLGSVGQVRPGLHVVIRTPDGAALPLGATGEITVRGESVFSGYLDDPDATAAAFYPGGWYRTGDLGRLDEEGYLFVTGRAREMINRGGEKIVPHEIDDVLRAHPAVADAAAFALPHPLLGQEVAAAVILRDGARLTERDLRRWAAAHLSLHKAPHRIWFVAELPRTGSGKVQRRILAEQVRGRGDEQR